MANSLLIHIFREINNRKFVSSRNWGAYGNQPTISCYSLVKHYRGECIPEMDEIACIQGRVGTGGEYGNQPTISCYSLVKHYRGEYMYLRWRIELVYRALSVRVL